MKVSMTINDTEVSAEVEPRTLLVHFIREQASLKGTNIGCDSSSCGACTVHLNGESVKSCTVLAVQADEQEVTTIEGLADGENLHPRRRIRRSRQLRARRQRRVLVGSFIANSTLSQNQRFKVGRSVKRNPEKTP